MKKFLLHYKLLILFISLSTSLFAQPAIQWDKTLGGTGDDRLVKVLTTTDGGYVLAGQSTSPANDNKTVPLKGTNDYWIIKYSSAGTKEWEKTFGGTSLNFLLDIQQTKDGGYMVGGSSFSDAGGDKSEDSRGSSDYWVIKLDASGIKQWDKTAGGSDGETLRSVRQLADGSYILAGESRSNKSGEKSNDRPPSFEDNNVDYWLVKLSATGTFEWDKTVATEGLGRLTDFEATADGGYIFGSDEGGYEETTARFHVIKLNAAFEKQWDKRYGRGGQYSEMDAIVQTADGGYVFAGFTESTIGGTPVENEESRDAYIVKVDKDGSPVWQKIFGSVDGQDETGERYWYTDYITSILETDNGNLLVGGYTAGLGGAGKTEDSRGLQDYWVFKLQADGEILWDKTIGGSQDDFLLSMVQTSDKGYLLGGYSKSPVSGEKTEESKDAGSKYDFWIVKLTAETPAVPGVITRFTVLGDKKHAAITWSSPAGSIIKKFDIEQSPDQLTWGHISTVTASKTRNNYQFTHQNPTLAIPVYYRLKLTLADNNVTYSRVRSVTIVVEGPAIRDQIVIGSTSNDKFGVMLPTADGGYILGGSNTGGAGGDKSEEGEGENDYWVIKVSANGTKQWDKTFGGTGKDDLTSIIQTSDGGYLLGGTSLSQAGGDKSETNRDKQGITGDFWIIKISVDGIKQWDKTLGGNKSDNLGSMQQVDERYILAGISDSNIGGDKTQARLNQYFPDYWIVEVANNGEKSRDRTLTKYGSFMRAVLQKTIEGGYILYDGVELSGSYSGDGGSALIKLSPNFEVESTVNPSMALGSVQQTADQGYILGGYIYTDGGFDYQVIKLSSNMDGQWLRQFGADQWDFLLDIKQTPDNGYILAGFSPSDIEGDKTEKNRGETDYWLVKIKDDGSKEWDKTIGGTGFDNLYFVHPRIDGSYLLGGTTTSPAGEDRTIPLRGETDFWVVNLASENPLPVTLNSFTAQKESNNSQLTWETTSETRSERFEVEHSINGKSWNDIATVNAKGESKALQTYQFTHVSPVSGENYYRLKMIDMDGSFTYSKIEQVKFELDFKVIVYPNPGAESIHLKVDWSKVARVQVLNSYGEILYKSEQKATPEINTKAFKAGMYFVKVILTDSTETIRKVVIGK